MAVKRSERRHLHVFVVLVRCVASVEAIWDDNFPKLHFGSQALSPSSEFPNDFGGYPVSGRHPQQLMLRFKVKPGADASAFEEDTEIRIQLSEFIGGDNKWTQADVEQLHSDMLISNGVINAGAQFSEAEWKASTSTLTIKLNAFVFGSQLQDSEYVVVLDAKSFVLGNGPIPPSCLPRGAPIYISSFLSNGVANNLFRRRFSMVAAVGCFGDQATSFGIQENAWITKSIGQDPERSGLGIETTITVTLASKLDLSSISSASDSIQTTIQISGLTGSGTGDGPIAIIEHPNQLSSIDGKFSAGSTLNAGQWQREAGTLSLTVTDDATLPAGIEFVFQFKLSLPIVPQESPDVSVSLRTGATFVIGPQAMTKAEGDAAPLKASTWRLLTANIGQSVSGPGQQNTVTITLKSNFDMQSTITSTSSITISGLVGFINPDSSAENKVEIIPVSINSVDGFFTDGVPRPGQPNSNCVKWTRETGSLELMLLQDVVFRGGTEYVFAIRLTNPFEPQSSPPVFVRSNGELATEMVSMVKAAASASPLYITNPSISMAKMGQSSSGAGAANTITLTLQSNVGVQTVEGSTLVGRVSITGLRGFTDSDGDILLVSKGLTDISALVVGQSAQWTKAASTLVLELAPAKQLQAGAVYVMSFTMRNPNIAQASPSISIELSGLQNVQVQRVAVVKAAGTAAPLLVSNPAFSTARIGQRSSGPEVANQLSLTLQANLMLSESMRLTLSGLEGSGSADNTALAVDCGGIFKSPAGTVDQGKWTQSSGTLELVVAASLSEQHIVVCSLLLSNPSSAREAAVVSVSVNSLTAGQVTNIIPATEMRNAPGNAAPFLVRPATFVTARIGHAKPYPGEEANTISVTVQSNVAIASVGSVVATITLRGLTGTRTQDTAELAVQGDHAQWTQITMGKAAWTQSSGTLVLTIAPQQTLLANTEYVFSFDLSNPLDSQEAPAIFISAAGGEQIEEMAVSKDSGGCIHQQGDAAPLFVHSRAFLTKRIGMKTSTRQGANVLSITLRSSVSLSSIAGSQTNIVISELQGFATPDSNALPITSSDMDVLGDTAEWRRDAGALVLHILSGRTMDASVEYRIDVEITNGVEVVAPRPTIMASNIGIIIPATLMDFDRRASFPAFSTSSAEEGAITELRISFRAEAEIAADDTLIVLLAGFQGSSTGAGDQIWGVTSTPPAFSAEQDRSSHEDKIAAGSSVAKARFTQGFSGRTPRAGSSADGLVGTTIAMDTSDLRLFGKDNVVAGSVLSIEGSSGHHHIFRQTSASTDREAVAHFFPKYPHGGSSTAVPQGATYKILPQLELTARSRVCAGTQVVIDIPLSAALRVPAGGISDETEVWMSHVSAGVARTATIGTLATIGDAGVEYSGANGREVEIELAAGASGELEGYQLQPAAVSSPSFVFVDGYRLVSSWDANTKSAHLFTGYGPKKQTQLKEEMAHGTLNHRKSLPPTTDDAWLQLADIGAVKPTLVSANQGSFLQVEDEILRFTGALGKGVESFAVPDTVGEQCRVGVGGALCLTEDNCLSVEFAGCDEPPTAVIAMDGAGAIQAILVNFGGACREGQTPALVGDIRVAEGVQCAAVPECGNGCGATLVAVDNMIEVKRAQLGTSPAELTASAEAPAQARVQPVSAILDEGMTQLLLYTSDERELDRANEQSLRIRYNRNVKALYAGDHVIAISNPETLGAGCRKGGVTCGELDVCATVTFRGCPVVPDARLQFKLGQVDPAGGVLGMGASTSFGGSLCRSGDVLTGKIELVDDVVCDIVPDCGSQCLPTLDDSQDLVLVRHEDMLNVVGVFPTGEEDYAVGDDIVRVHPARDDTAYRIVLVPPTRVVQQQQISLCDESGGLTSEAVCAQGQATKLVDDSGGVVADVSVQSADCLAIECAGLSFATRPDGSRVTYPAACAESCNVTGLGGYPIASDQVLVAIESSASPRTPVLRLVLSITYNLNFQPGPNRRQLAAPTGFEYRINGDCSCPASSSGTAACDIWDNGAYQALLVPVSVCASLTTSALDVRPTTTPTSNTTSNVAAMPSDANTPIPATTPAVGVAESSGTNTGAIVGGVVGGLFAVILISSIAYLLNQQQPLADSADKEPESMVENDSEKVQQAPVLVGRPVPRPPDPFLHSPRFSTSPVMPPDSAWGANWSLVQQLPSSFTPGPAVPLLAPQPPISPGLRMIPTVTVPAHTPLEPTATVVSPPYNTVSPARTPPSRMVPRQRRPYQVGVRISPRQADRFDSERDEPPVDQWRTLAPRPQQSEAEDDDSESDGSAPPPQVTPSSARVPYGV